MIWWEAVYRDGTRDMSVNVPYKNIRRDDLFMFELWGDGHPLLALPIPDGMTGHNLVYRRRTQMGQGGGITVLHLAGWVPSGPIVAIDETNQRLHQTTMFRDGDPVFYWPQPHLGEGERWAVPA